MKKIVTAPILLIQVFLFLIPSASLFSLEYGVSALSEVSLYSYQDSDSENELELETSAWADQPLPGDLTFSLGGFLNYLMLNSHDGITHEFSGDLLKAELRRRAENAGEIGFALGRQAFRDFSGYLLETPADGISLEYRGNDARLRTAAGLSGLLLDASSPVIATKSEVARVDPFFGPSRMLFLFDIDYYGFSSGPVLKTGLIINLDVPEEGDFTGDSFDSYSLGAGLEGSVSAGVNYNVFCFVQQSNYYGDPDREYLYTQGVAAAFGGELSVSGLFLHNSIFSVTLLTATGDSGHSVFEDAGGGISHQFTTLTKTEFPGLYDYELSNLVYMAGEYSFNPIPEIGSFSLVPRVSAVLRPSAGDGTLPQIPLSGVPAGFLGTELGLYGQYELSFGLDVLAGAALFLPAQKFRDAGVFSAAGFPFSLSLGCSYSYAAGFP